ncbi:unnamed protein product [Merluccius merluccius]
MGPCWTPDGPLLGPSAPELRLSVFITESRSGCSRGDVKHFVDLVKWMLQLDTGLLITRQDVMEHPFSITARHGNINHSSTSQQGVKVEQMLSPLIHGGVFCTLCYLAKINSEPLKVCGEVCRSKYKREDLTQVGELFVALT